MADFFFGFDTSFEHQSLEDELHCPLEEDDVGEEEEYDALNDETFGSEATIGDWEKDHEKLAEIAESSRPQNQSSSSLKKNGVDVDIEDNLSHLVLDEKDGIVPRPGVWDSPSSLSLPKPHQLTALPPTIKNVCTVEELEKELIANRALLQQTKPLYSPAQQQHQQKSEGALRFDTLPLNQKVQINGPLPPRFPPGLGVIPPHPVVLPPNMRFPPPQFMQHPRLIPNQVGNVLRYPLPPHLMMPHTAQRQPHHGSYNNFPQPPHNNLGPAPFLRSEHGLMTGYSNNQTQHQQQHSYSHFGNQRPQNRSFHHGDQQGNHQPFFKNNQYLHRNHDRNNQRYYHYYHDSHGMDETNASGEYDEYAGLMTDREKQFLITIQLVQLNTSEPYFDDYYYTIYTRRRKGKTAPTQKDKKNNNNNGCMKDSREGNQPPRVFTRNAYTPAQFENSLGKLQACSIIAPRKIIDIDVVSNNDPRSTAHSQHKDARKRIQLLLEIERLYVMLLKLDDLSNLLGALNDKQSADSDRKDAIRKSAAEVISSTLSCLQQVEQEDKLTSMLTIRKGKILLLQFLPYVNATEYQAQLEELWCAIFKGIGIIARRDSYLLTNTYSDFYCWITDVKDLQSVLRVATALSDGTNQAHKNYPLRAILCKLSVSAIASIIEKIEEIVGTKDISLPTKWTKFLVNLMDRLDKEEGLCFLPFQPLRLETYQQLLKRVPELTKAKMLKFLLVDRIHWRDLY